MSAGANHSDGANSGSSEWSAAFNIQEPLVQATCRRSEVVRRRSGRAAAQFIEAPVDPRKAWVEAGATIVLSSLRDTIQKTQVLPFKFKGWQQALHDVGCPNPKIDDTQLKRRVTARIGELCVTTTGQLEQQKKEIQGECSPSLIAPGLNY